MWEVLGADRRAFAALLAENEPMNERDERCPWAGWMKLREIRQRFTHRRRY